MIHGAEDNDTCGDIDTISQTNNRWLAKIYFEPCPDISQTSKIFSTHYLHR